MTVGRGGFLWCLLPAVVAIASATPPQTFAELFAPQPDYPYFAAGRDWPESTDVPPDAWSVDRAAVLAQLSLLAYVPDEATVHRRAVLPGFDQGRFFTEGGTQAWLFTSTTDCLVVFRGTEPDATEDLLTDVKLLPVRVDESITAHGGFARALADLTPSLDAALAEAPDRRLWITGHSLGGALAQLYGWHQRDRIAAVYTFGAPRVLTRGSVAAYDAQVPVFRVVNNNDLVPHVPTPPVYAHAGTEWFLDATGALHREPTLGAKLDEAWEGHRRYLERWLQHWRESGELTWSPGDGLADHAPVAYATLLVKAAAAAP